MSTPRTLQKYYVYFLMSIFLVIWAISGWHPKDRADWFAENTILLICVPLTVGFSRGRKQFSKLSYTLATLFLVLHVIGSHYGYGFVPFGNTLGNVLGGGGNVYDKLVHFSFGLLMFYPVWEFFTRTIPVKGLWSYFLPYMTILGLAALYEIFEWLTVLRLDPKVGYLFIGGTDPFDSSKDMFVAGVGALITLGVLAASKYFSSKR